MACSDEYAVCDALMKLIITKERTMKRWYEDEDFYKQPQSRRSKEVDDFFHVCLSIYSAVHNSKVIMTIELKFVRGLK